MDNDAYKRGFAKGYKQAKEDREEPSISSGTACFLVKDRCLASSSADMHFLKWLQSNGFTKWPKGHGYYDNVDWFYINLNSKMYNPGMPGIPLTSVICEHAITIDEFKAIYAIFDQYKGKKPLQF